MSWQKAVMGFADDAYRFAQPYLGKAVQAAKPIVNRVGIPTAVGAVSGGVRGAQEGGLGGAITGGLGGGGTGMLLGSIPGASNLNPYMQTGLGLTGGLFGHGVPSGVATNVAPRVGGAVAQNIQNVPNVSGNYIGGGGGAVPPLGGAHAGMYQGPDGSIWANIDPAGWRAGMRYGSGLDTQQQISNQNRWFQSMFPQSEMKNKADFERELAARQLGANIDMAKKMQEGTLSTTQNIAEKNAITMGNLLNTRQKYF